MTNSVALTADKPMGELNMTYDAPGAKASEFRLSPKPIWLLSLHWLRVRPAVAGFYRGLHTMESMESYPRSTSTRNSAGHWIAGTCIGSNRDNSCNTTRLVHKQVLSLHNVLPSTKA